MKSFTKWIEEAKKGKKESMPPTVVSSPLRGQNQDQSGFNGKNSVADYTISDEKVPDSWEENTPAERRKSVKKLMKLAVVHGAKEYKEEVINELSPELIGKVNKARLEKPSKTIAAAKTLSHAVKKAWLKTRVGVVKEMIAGVGDVRTTPGNMVRTSKAVTKNAPASSHQLQSAADKRRIQLDKIAQKQRDEQEKQREQIQKQREQDASTRDKSRQKQSTIEQ